VQRQKPRQKVGAFGRQAVAVVGAVVFDEQRIELIVLAGLYHMVSFVTNALALPLEPFAARFPQRR